MSWHKTRLRWAADWNGSPALFRGGVIHQGQELHLCEICYRTSVGQTIMYRNIHDAGEVSVAKMLAEVGNLLLEKLGK